jgi:hypothetical protein
MDVGSNRMAGAMDKVLAIAFPGYKVAHRPVHFPTSKPFA